MNKEIQTMTQEELSQVYDATKVRLRVRNNKDLPGSLLAMADLSITGLSLVPAYVAGVIDGVEVTGCPTPDVYRNWNVSVEQVFLDGWKNQGSFIATNMETFIQQCIPEVGYNPEIGEERGGSALTIVLTESRENGAVALYDTQFLSQIFPDRDFFILPSSVDEIIVADPYDLPIEEEIYDEMSFMVRNVNQTGTIQPNQVLANHAFIFSQREKKVLTAEEYF